MKEITQEYTELIKRYWQTYPQKAGWAKTARLDAFNAFEKVGFPTTKDEKWKYTNLKALLEGEIDFDMNSITSIKKNSKLAQDYYCLYFTNGIYNEQLSNLPDNDHLICKDFKQVSDNEIKEFVNDRTVFQSEQAMTYMGDALLEQGVLLIIKKSLDRPLVLIHLDDHTEARYLRTTHIFLKIEADQKLELFEHYHNPNHSELITNAAEYFILEKNSKIEHCFLQQQNTNSLFFHSNRTKVKQNAHYGQVQVHTGAKAFRSSIHMELLEKDAQCASYGLYQIAGEQHGDIYSFINHLEEETYSDQLFKGLLDDQARGIFTGRVRVEQKAQRSKSSQLNKNLLLKNKARANSRPQLEIFADDVKCSHGSTTSQLDQEELLYFQFRGIGPKQANRLLTKAFTNEILMKIESPKLRQLLLSHAEIEK